MGVIRRAMRLCEVDCVLLRCALAWAAAWGWAARLCLWALCVCWRSLVLEWGTRVDCGGVASKPVVLSCRVCITRVLFGTQLFTQTL